jgi:hypothetical protein
VDSAETPPRDQEFELAVAPARLSVDHNDAPEDYLRIVANPFLAAFGFLVWLKAVQSLLGQKMNRDLYGPLAPIIFLVFLAALWSLRFLLQYHCLDCGGSGRLKHWREHHCGPSELRRRSGQFRRFRGPSPFVQVILWFWVILAVGVMLLSYSRV